MQEQRSPKDYVVAVALSGVFGILGIQHFYLGRYLEGTCDLGLSITGYYFLWNGEVASGSLHSSSMGFTLLS